MPLDESVTRLNVSSMEQLTQFTKRSQPSLLEPFHRNISKDIEDPRLFPPSHPQYYFVSKSDMERNESYSLNIIKPKDRSKLKAFLSNRPQALKTFKRKFLNVNPTSSQLSLLPPRVIDVSKRDSAYSSMDLSSEQRSTRRDNAWVANNIVVRPQYMSVMEEERKPIGMVKLRYEDLPSVKSRKALQDRVIRDQEAEEARERAEKAEREKMVNDYVTKLAEDTDNAKG